MTYYQTVPTPQTDLVRYRSQASDQDARVLAFFRQRPGELYTQEQIHEAVMPNAPRSSVCRAVNTLTRLGRLEKTGTLYLSSQGRRVHTWRYLPAGPVQRSLL
jgi:predicted transcriptional regulator